MQQPASVPAPIPAAPEAAKPTVGALVPEPSVRVGILVDVARVSIGAESGRRRAGRLEGNGAPLGAARDVRPRRHRCSRRPALPRPGGQPRRRAGSPEHRRPRGGDRRSSSRPSSGMPRPEPTRSGRGSSPRGTRLWGSRIVFRAAASPARSWSKTVAPRWPGASGCSRPGKSSSRPPSFPPRRTRVWRPTHRPIAESWRFGPARPAVSRWSTSSTSRTTSGVSCRTSSRPPPSPRSRP